MFRLALGDSLIRMAYRQIYLRLFGGHFIEVGASDGLENNSSWLAIGRRFAGLMVEGDARKSKRCKRLLSVINAGVKNLRMFVTKDNVEEIRRAAATPNPDLFSLDIDGNDYYVAEAVMASGFRPAVFAVEYNSAYGPIKSLSIKYQENFDYSRAHPSRLYYGVSITGWRRFFQRHGYRFVTVDLNGTNAFFADPAAFSPGFLQALQGLDYAENRHQTVRFQCSWEEQFPRIEHLEYEEIA